MASEREGKRYEGKVAVVTGGASGIGEAIVLRLLAEGGFVVAGDVDDARLEALAGRAEETEGKLETIHTDVCDEDSVAAMVARAVERFDRLDCGFNVAGGGAAGPIVDTTSETFRDVVDLCLLGVFHSMKHEARQMVAQGGGGAIVNVASLSGGVPAFGTGAYSAAKAGVLILTKVATLELGQEGIRVNSISPGLTKTPAAERFGLFENPEIRGAFLERIPLGRWAEPDDQAAAALFLASGEAEYVNGVNLLVDGGWESTGYPDMRPYFAEAKTTSS